MSNGALWPGILGPLLRGESLGEETAARAMSSILAGEATAAQIAALATGLRIRGERPEELAGLVRAMLTAAAPLEVPGPLLDTCGTGGDRAGTFNVSTLAALVAAAAGCRVAKHGNRAASGRCGSADVLEALGVAIDLPAPGVARTIDQVGIGFCFAPVFHPAMRHAAGPRRELGVPTVFNFLGPLTNPARPRRQVVGVADPKMAPVIAEALRSGGAERAWVCFGDDGLDELTTTTTSTVLDVRPEGVERWTLDPRVLGIPPASRGDLAGGDVPRCAEVASRVLAGEPGPPRDVVLLNSAAGLLVSGIAAELPDALELAGAVLDDGRAERKLTDWARSSQRAATT